MPKIILHEHWWIKEEEDDPREDGWRAYCAETEDPELEREGKGKRGMEEDNCPGYWLFMSTLQAES